VRRTLSLLHRTIWAILVAKGSGRSGYSTGLSRMSKVWKTKFGLRRVRQDAPTLEEAIFAARGLTGNLTEQAEIAAALMGLRIEDVMPEVIKFSARNKALTVVGLRRKDAPPRAVVVERRTSRRPASSRPFGSPS
jgi:hypothetical protein